MLFRSHKRQDHQLEVQGRRLADESAAFLAGRYALDLQRQGMPVPTWAWLSELAHAPVEQLLTRMPIGNGVWLRDHSTAQWENAIALLAHELLATARLNGCSVEELQRSTIVEAELGYDPSRFGAWASGPGVFVSEVRRTLRQYRARPLG
ncbi:MAG: hypothetical protein ACLQPH_19495 [Acidimicrobiales bacterium]